MNKVEKDVLYELYVIRGKPMHEIAKELGVAVGTVYNYMKKYEIKSKTHRECFEKLKENGWEYPRNAREKISKAQKGRVFSEETKEKMSDSAKIKGIGHKKQRKDGYIAIYFPDHPKSNKDGYIMEHVLIMECLIGRWVKNDEVVHHVNGVRNDNRKENLKLMTVTEQVSFHSKKRWEEKKKGGMTYQ